MSTDWNVKCLDCDEIHYFNDANHQDELMLALCKHSELLAAMADIEGHVEVQTLWGRVDCSWFKKHLGHQLLPINEYGDLYGHCREYFRCGACDWQHKCKLIANHEGPCSGATRKKDDAKRG